ncbi:hypothetical protein ACW23B_29385 [Streptomyces albidoflavus]
MDSPAARRSLQPFGSIDAHSRWSDAILRGLATESLPAPASSTLQGDWAGQPAETMEEPGTAPGV